MKPINIETKHIGWIWIGGMRQGASLDVQKAHYTCLHLQSTLVWVGTFVFLGVAYIGHYSVVEEKQALGR